HFFSTIVPVMHVDNTIEHNKHLFTVVNMPAVRLISPVQLSGNTLHIGNKLCAPGPGRGKVFASYHLHRFTSLSQQNTSPPEQVMLFAKMLLVFTWCAAKGFIKQADKVTRVVNANLWADWL